MRISNVIMIGICAVVSSCASKRTVTVQKSKSESYFDKLIDKDQGFKQNTEGQWVADTAKRSDYDQKRYVSSSKKNIFAAKEIEKKTWSSDQSFAKKTYQAEQKKSFQESSSFEGKTYKEGQHQVGRKNYQTEQYETGTYATKGAHEADQKEVEKNTNKEVETRKKVFKEPVVYDWREVRKMNVSDTQQMTGR